MNNIKIFILVAILYLGYDSFYVLPVTQKAVLLFFGELVEGEIEPGINFKLPIIQTVKRYSAKLQIDDATPQTYLTQNNEGLTVDSFALWRILDVANFYRATGGSFRILENLLEQRIDNGLRNQFGNREKWEVVSGEREQMMDEILSEINTGVEELGIEVIDIRINRIELPEAASESVYNRMVAERRRLANEARAEGQEISEAIRAEADKQRVILLAEAYRKSETLRGEGDAKAIAIFAGAYKQDPELYQFTRSLEAYRKVFNKENDTLILDTDSQFFNYLNSSESLGR